MPTSATKALIEQPMEGAFQTALPVCQPLRTPIAGTLFPDEISEFET